jgi:hypothetical protein
MKNKEVSSSLPKTQNIQQAYYQVILKQINEDADILMQNKDESGKPYGEVEEFTVTDDVAKQIKSNIRKNISFETPEGKTSLREIIQKILIDANWAKISSINFLLESISNVFNQEEIVPGNIVKYVELRKKSQNLIKEKLINNPATQVNLKDLIPDWFHSFFESKNATNIVEILWDLVPNTKPSSGKGELIFTLISSCEKASQGDLKIDNDLIEMKGSDGTMGGDNHIIDTSTELNEILQKDLTNISKINRKQNLIFRLKKEIPTKHETFRNEIISMVQNNASSEEIKNTIDKSILTDRNKEMLYKTLISSLTIPKFNYRDSLLAFFSQYEMLSDEQIAAGIFAGRNYKNITSSEEVKRKIQNIVAENKNLLFKKHHERHFTYELASLIAALHLCAYQEVYKFKGIIFVNDKTPSKNMTYFSFKGNTVLENLEEAYSFILNFKPTINLAMTQIQKSAGFNFFPKG